MDRKSGHIKISRLSLMPILEKCCLFIESMFDNQKNTHSEL